MGLCILQWTMAVVTLTITSGLEHYKESLALYSVITITDGCLTNVISHSFRYDRYCRHDPYSAVTETRFFADGVGYGQKEKLDSGKLDGNYISKGRSRALRPPADETTPAAASGSQRHHVMVLTVAVALATAQAVATAPALSVDVATAPVAENCRYSAEATFPDVECLKSFVIYLP